MHTRNFIAALLAALGLALSPGVAQAQSQPTLDWSLVDGIGGVSGNGTIAVVATISPEDSGFLSGGTFSIHSVFEPWPSIYIPPFVPPTLQISLATNNVIIRWPAGYSSLQLERASILTGATNIWTHVTNSPIVVDLKWQVTLPATNASSFFRLRID